MVKSLKIEWDGREYKIPETELFELIESIERHIILPDLLEMIGAGKPNFSALARPFHAMLVHAGVPDPPSVLELRRILVREGFENLRAQAAGEKPTSTTAMLALATMVELLMDGAEIPDAGKDGQPDTMTKKKMPSRGRATR